MTLNKLVEDLFSQYHGLKNLRRGFEEDPSVNNVALREQIPGPDGNPSYGDSPGLVGRVIGEKEEKNRDELSNYINKDTYGDFKKEFYETMSDQGQALSYMSVLDGNRDIAAATNSEVYLRIAKKNNLDRKLAESNRNFASLSDNDKLKAYVKAINSDKALVKEYASDPTVQALGSLALAKQIEELLAKGKVNEACAFIQKELKVDLASLYRNEGNIYNAQLVVQEVADKQREYAFNLMAENSSVAKDVEKALDKTDAGYARAAAEVYSVYNMGQENKFRAEYKKAKEERKASSLKDFKKKIKQERNKKEELFV